MADNIDRTDRAPTTVFNVPNQLTALRLVLSVVLFVFISFGFYMTSTVLFVIAASTDWLDGHYARKYGQVTTLGRILDPFADKVIICGTFIFLAAEPAMIGAWFGVKAWMVVVIVGRELLVTALRSFIEQRGSDFSAKMAGKLKMVLQCITAGTALFCLAYTDPGAPTDYSDVPTWSLWLLAGSLWSAVALTVYSGVQYILAAVKAVRR
ncbi:MAG: CDP-diacylglycerol--glycerol-3-phosphate 3-phosphatidyltransferase [Candidatus Nealsonbacteria bacterium]|nr:CDP-diacylglycerol--glycerol-3-phosphate 3-phosphatidyltransferase [Candidatus Nealsonbacteria bacterium]